MWKSLTVYCDCQLKTEYVSIRWKNMVLATATNSFGIITLFDTSNLETEGSEYVFW